MKYFERAIEKDAGYAVAYAGLADCYVRLLDYNYLRPFEAAAKAHAAAVKALDLDETLTEAHTSLGHLAFHEFNWPAAERAFKRAVELNPNYGTAHYYYANFLAALRRFEDAILEAQRTLEIDPVSPSVGMNAASIFYLARRYDEALAQAEKVLEIDPGFRPVHYCIGLIYEQQRKYDRAMAAFQSTIAPLGHLRAWACGRRWRTPAVWRASGEKRSRS